MPGPRVGHNAPPERVKSARVLDIFKWARLGSNPPPHFLTCNDTQRHGLSIARGCWRCATPLAPRGNTWQRLARGVFGPRGPRVGHGWATE